MNNPPEITEFDSDTTLTTFGVKYLTKIWIGNKWWYIDTDRKWKHRNFHFRRFKLGWVSYKKIKEF